MSYTFSQTVSKKHLSMQVCDSAQYHDDHAVFSSLSRSVLSKEPSWDCFFFLYVSRWNDNVSNLVTLHTELSMLMMGWPPPCSTEMLTFNLCTVISLLHTWNWCTLFLLIKSKNSRGSRQVGDLLPYTAITAMADSRMNQGCSCSSFCVWLCVVCAAKLLYAWNWY